MSLENTSLKRLINSKKIVMVKTWRSIINIKQMLVLYATNVVNLLLQSLLGQNIKLLLDNHYHYTHLSHFLMAEILKKLEFIGGLLH